MTSNFNYVKTLNFVIFFSAFSTKAKKKRIAYDIAAWLFTVRLVTFLIFHFFRSFVGKPQSFSLHIAIE